MDKLVLHISASNDLPLVILETKVFSDLTNIRTWGSKTFVDALTFKVAAAMLTGQRRTENG